MAMMSSCWEKAKVGSSTGLKARGELCSRLEEEGKLHCAGVDMMLSSREYIKRQCPNHGSPGSVHLIRDQMMI